MTQVDRLDRLDRLERDLANRVALVGDRREPRAAIDELVMTTAPVLSPIDAAAVADGVEARLRGLGPLQPLCDDPDVDDILVNGPGAVWVERHGVLERTDVTVDRRDIDQVIERVFGPLGLRLDRTNAVVDGRLPDGSRVSVVGPPLALDGPVLSVRRFRSRPLTLDEFACPEVAALLVDLVHARANLVVFGSTGAGKTSLLGALAAAIPAGERVLTIEDTAELRLPGDHVVRFEARPPNAEGRGAVTIRQLVRAALRLRPDRIVVGEVRGAEALDMVWAMATGHDGSMSTCHANDAHDALLRLETFALTADVPIPSDSIRAQLRSAVDVLVGVGRVGNGRRRVVSVTEVTAAPSAVLLRPLVDGDRVVDGLARPRRGGVPS